MFRGLDALRVCLGTLILLLAGLPLIHAQLTTVVAAAAATAAAVLVCRAFVSAVAARPVPPGRIRTAIRDRERRTAFLPQRDPDASGRPRPRAPGRPCGTAA
ncbi:DUF6412 domain-containing protein [Streptantibioticus rubrisoli]|uniref:DUF6412 domain-containing protein n=1 Tax=Streptantibioticus rubrisoli TaxID=1387313 RepID=A0ABT1PCA3_9ACTN|nr:DUF6412 domain-containing protein [Streptantibioticus rubrisoli]MCQ4042436.1 DUF6412 domain-containing protein [Streptantibioticus rubrisoli]